MILRDRFVTYAMLYSGVRSVQATLGGLSLDKEKPVGILIDTPSRHLIVMLALLKSGYTVASLRSDLISAAMQANITTIITEGVSPLPSSSRAIRMSDQWFVTDPGKTDATVTVPSDRFMLIRFTSGATGTPQPIALTTNSILGRSYERQHSLAASFRRVLTTFGLSNAAPILTLAVLQSGNTILFSPFEHVLETMSMYGVEALYGSAAQIEELVRLQSRKGMALPLKLVHSGGGSLPANFQKAVAEAFHADFEEAYSSTEAGQMGVTFGYAFLKRARSPNCFFPVNEVEIVGARGEPLPAGEVGRVRVRSPFMGSRFEGRMSVTAENCGDGWFYPGDVGKLDEDGFLVLAGRSDELINDGGLKVAPQDLEVVLQKMPGLNEFAVFRARSEDNQFVPGLAVVGDSSLNLTAVNQWIENHGPEELAGVRFRQLLRVAEIPRNDMGKVKRQLLAELGHGVKERWGE